MPDSTPPSSRPAAPRKLTLDEIKSRVRAVCICKGINMGKVCDAIQKGQLKTIDQVNRACGTGNGGCGATRCRPVITELLSNGGFPVSSQDMEKLRGESEDDSNPDDNGWQ